MHLALVLKNYASQFKKKIQSEKLLLPVFIVSSQWYITALKHLKK